MAQKMSIVRSVLACVAVAAAVGSTALPRSGRSHDATEVATTPAVVTLRASPSPTPSVSPVTASPSPTPSPVSPAIDMTIAAAGDVLPHESTIRKAKVTGGYSFASMFAAIRPWIAGADLALCHLEVPVAPNGKPSGYPVFGAPATLPADLAAMGWDGCSTASNHSLDRGWDGVVSTVEAMHAAGLGVVGSQTSASQAYGPQLYRVAMGGRVITVAQLAATYGLNGMPVPANAPWAVNLIDVNQIIAQARAARAGGADLVLVSLHDGVEYRSTPSAQQRTEVAALAASGVVDLVIGHHAHVPQPIEKLPGGPDGHGMWVAYGLGNFISAQSGRTNAAATEAGEILYAQAHADAGGLVHIASVAWTPITVDVAHGNVVYPLTGPAGTGVGGLSARDVTMRLGRVAKVVSPAVPMVMAPPIGHGAVVTVLPR